MTAKERFQQLPTERKFHEDLVTNPAFVKALDHAMLQMLDEEHTTETVTTAARLNGAMRFKGILLHLAEAPTTFSHNRERENLNHKI